MKLAELAERIGAELVGADADVAGVAALDAAGPGDVSFLANAKYAKQMEKTRAAAVICAPATVATVATSGGGGGAALLRTADPYFAYQKALVALHGHRRHPFAGVHPLAAIDPSAVVGGGTVVYPNVYVGPGAVVGRDCVIYPGVTIYDGCVLGDRVIVHAGTAIGVDGYGYATHKGVHHKIPQIGNVVIEDDVEIGANCSIERGALASTVIGAGTKIDQLVVVGHGCRLGPHCLMVAQSGIAGSVTMGHHVVLAAQAGVTGHLKLGDGVTVGAQSGVINDVEAGQTVVGTPAMPASHARRVYILFTQLPALVERIKTLEQQVAELATGDDGADVV